MSLFCNKSLLRTLPPKLNAEYSKMLRTPVPLNGPDKDFVESLQKQIDFHFGEIYRLKRAQNSRAAIHRLPAELLSQVFLYIVEAGLQNDTNFSTRTFSFLQVCKLWNEVAVDFPRLWVWLIPGAIKAWPVFKARSKSAPLFLTYQPRISTPARDILADPTVSRRIDRLDFSGSRGELDDLLGAFASIPPSNASSIRLQTAPYNPREPQEHLNRFLSSPFPKLSNLEIENILPDPTSPIFVATNLTSLKLRFPSVDGHRYTLPQFSQILQYHPNLRELDLEKGGMPVPEPSGPLVPLSLPLLVDLRLNGTKPDIMKFINLVDMSSPLHNVVIYFQGIYNLAVPALTEVMKEILTAYYGCAGLAHPRTVNRLTISHVALNGDVIFDAGSHPTSHSASNLVLQFSGLGVLGSELMEKVFSLFPLKDVREFAVNGLDLIEDKWRRMLRKVKRLSHLQLNGLCVGSVLDALDSKDPENSSRPLVPKLQSLTLSHLDILFLDVELSDILARRSKHSVRLKNLVVRSCRVHHDRDRVKLKGLVKKVTWEHVIVMGSDYEGSESDEETDSYYEDSDHWEDDMYYFPYY